MLVKKYKSRIISIKNAIQGIYTLEFRTHTERYKYLPGQFLHLALDQDYDGIDQWPESRCFSMQSNPREESIRITYSVKGKFTKKMEHNLKIGIEIWLKLPYGNLFTQHHNKINTVFVSGGTGITPFLSLFAHESFNDYTNPRIYLGFRCHAYNIFQKELSYLKFCNLKIFYKDVNGLLNIHHIFSENGTNSDYFISGPPDMIKTFKQTLIDKGVPPTKILTDDWE